MSKLHNVRGRITYISSHTKQENLYAVYETTDRHYWTELARFNQQEFLKSGTEGKCIEARELKNKLFHEALEKEYGTKTVIKAERERNKLEIELSDLKGLARLTKKKELESKIDTKTEEIRTLKAGLSGIVRQHGFVTVQDFYTAFYTAQRATDAYQKECAKWEETYGEKATPKAETMHEKIKRYQEKADRQNASQPHRSRDKGAR